LSWFVLKLLNLKLKVIFDVRLHWILNA
jgi:hypothetical protein